VVTPGVNFPTRINDVGGRAAVGGGINNDNDIK
jgi:hypothetical protein